MATIRPDGTGGGQHDPQPATGIVRRCAVPGRALRPYIERFWSWTAPPGAELPTVFPGTGAELFLHLGSAFAVEEDAGHRVALPAGHLLCLRSRSARLVSTGPTAFIAVRFRAGALRHFNSIPLAELNDRYAPAEEVLDVSARSPVDGLCSTIARLDSADDFAAGVRVVETMLNEVIRRRGSTLTTTDRAIARLYYGAGRERVSQVAEALGIGRRHLERMTGSALGLSPKHFQRLARFHHVTRRLLVRACPSTLEVALDAGYYDQAHFIHEVQALTGRTPGAVFTAASRASHFYNPSRRSDEQARLLAARVLGQETGR